MRGPYRTRREAGPTVRPSGTPEKVVVYKDGAMSTDTTTETGSGRSDLPFDPDALREKYREERDRRLRPDANDQYIEVTGDFERYLVDPYVAPIVRDPLTGYVDVVIVGGGFGGLLAGARLREVGVKDIRVIEKGGDFGGTWYWNRYPGAMCDVESYIYLPLLEEIGYVPKEKYTRAPEILEHSRAIGRHFNLYDNACFQTEVTELRWDEEIARWIVSTNRNDRMRARFVCMASGPLHRPKLPGIPGIETFAGHTFHTSRWDYGYTGGDPDGNLTGCAASGSASSGPARRPCSASRTSASGPSTCTCSSARRRRSTGGTTDPPTPSGPRASRRDGSGAGWRTSTRSCPAASSQRTSSTTAGPTSSASCS
jgi:hypothetical protein